MWIKINNATRGMTDPEISKERLEFNDNGKAQVTKEVGEQFVEKYDSIEKIENEKRSGEVN